MALCVAVTPRRAAQDHEVIALARALAGNTHVAKLNLWGNVRRSPKHGHGPWPRALTDTAHTVAPNVAARCAHAGLCHGRVHAGAASSRAEQRPHPGSRGPPGTQPCMHTV